MAYNAKKKTRKQHNPSPMKLSSKLDKVFSDYLPHHLSISLNLFFSEEIAYFLLLRNSIIISSLLPAVLESLEPEKTTFWLSPLAPIILIYYFSSENRTEHGMKQKNAVFAISKRTKQDLQPLTNKTAFQTS